MGQHLQISMLGGFDVSLDGRPIPHAAWRRNRARALVKLLALASSHRLHREQLIDALWPDLGPDAGASNLRKAVHFARHALGVDHIRSIDDTVALQAPAVATDVEAFEAALNASRVSDAIEIYRGDLLPDDRFEPWAEDPRDRLRLRFHRALIEEARTLDGEGRFDAAVETLERLVASDPLHEDAHLLLVRILAASGARHRALADYRRFSERLRVELDIEPEPGLVQLADDIVSGRFDAAMRGADADSTGRVSGLASEGEQLRLVTAVSASAGQAAGRSSDPDMVAWAATFRPIVERWGGVGEPQPNGAFLGLFGVPAVHEDDPVRAIRAALEMAELTPAVQVGVAMGEAATAAGTEPPVRRTSGPALEEAAALREAARSGSVLVSERARLAAGPGFRYAKPEHEGLGDLVGSARRLLDRHVDPMVPARSQTPLVGRDAELALVLGLFDDTVTNERPRLVELMGPAGVGKSRLALEVANRVAERWPNAMILRGRCQPGGRDATFDALGQVLREACGVGLTDVAADARAKIRGRLSTMLNDVDPIDVGPTMSALAMTAGIDLTDNPLGGLQPAEASDRIANAWSILAGACATAAPTVFLIEDLHWARQELLDLIGRIANRTHGPLLVLVTARPELHESGGPVFGIGDTSTIAIGPLGAAQSDQLFRSIASEAEVDDRTREDLLARAEGNPFFLEQLVHHLRSGGQRAIPDTLQTLLTARLDGLPGAERRVLQEASVVGRVFWEAPLVAVLEGERVAARLASLERRGFVVRRARSTLPGQAEYWICHALLHDVAYASLSGARRARSHAAAGSWLEALAGDRVEEVSDLLAHHYSSALAANVPQLTPDDGIAREEIRGRAFRYLVRAGDAARRRFVTDRAIELHGRALAVASTRGERLVALEALAWDHEDAFHGDEAADLYREALELARTDHDRTGDRARLCRRLAWLMAWNPGAFRANPSAAEAEALVDEGMTYAVDDEERTWLLLVRGAAARLYRGSEPLGQGSVVDPRSIKERLAAAERALAQSRQLGRDDIARAAENVLGLLHGQAGNYQDMLELARKQVAALRPDDSRLDQSDAIRKLATHLINVRADFEQGLELGRQCRNLLGSSGAAGPHQVMHTLWPILASLFFLGRWDELLTVAEEHVQAFRMEPARVCQFVRDGPAIGASVLMLRGQVAEGQAMARLLGDPLDDLAGASAWQARLALVRGDPATARAIARDKSVEGRVYGPQHAAVLVDALAGLADWDAATKFLPMARVAQAGNALIEPTADRLEGLLSRVSGNAAGAEGWIRRSIRGFRRLKVPYEEARSLEALRDTLPDAGSAVAGTEAAAIYRRLGVRPSPSRISP